MMSEMKTLFTNARLIDPENGTDQTGALLIEGQVIKDVIYGDTPDLDAETVDCGVGCASVSRRMKAGRWRTAQRPFSPLAASTKSLA